MSRCTIDSTVWTILASCKEGVYGASIPSSGKRHGGTGNEAFNWAGVHLKQAIISESHWSRAGRLPVTQRRLETMIVRLGAFMACSKGLPEFEQLTFFGKLFTRCVIWRLSMAIELRSWSPTRKFISLYHMRLVLRLEATEKHVSCIENCSESV